MSYSLSTKWIFAISIICFSTFKAQTAIFPPDQSNADNWNPTVEVISSRGYQLFAELFDDLDDIEITVIASYSAWSESPLYVESINSILFSSPSDRNLYQYDLDTQETYLFIENAGEFGGTYDPINHGNISLDDCSECGPNGLTTGLKDYEDYVIMNQLALSRVIAFDPSDPENTIIVIADNYVGTVLNSPNDVTTTSDGQSIYFTDPTFGLQASSDGSLAFFNSFDRSALGFQGVYRVDYDDVDGVNTEPELVVSCIPGPNGVAVSDKYLIISNTGSPGGWAPYWDIYSIKNKKYKLKETIVFDMGQLAWNSFTGPAIPLADGMEIYNDEILLAVCPGGICLIDLKKLEIVGRITIDHLISNIYIYDGYIYVTSADNLFTITLTA